MKTQKRLRRAKWGKGKPSGWQPPSDNADNYHFCHKCLANKYCYATAKKAKTALKFNPHCIRYYWCKSCCAYHLTSESKEKYWDNLDPILMKRYGNFAARPIDKDVSKE